MAIITTPKEIRPGDRIIYVDDYPVIRAQRVSLAPNFNTTELNEIGSDSILESIPDTITTQVTIETNSIGNVDLFQKLMGEKAASPRLSGTAANSWTGTQADFENAIVDVVMAVREQDMFRRSIYIPNCYLTSFDFSYSVDGVATENYSLLGDVDYDAYGSYKDVKAYIGSYSATVLATGFAISGTNALAANYTPLQASVNNIVVATGNQITLSTSSNDTLVRWSGTTWSGAAGGDRFRLVAYKNSPDLFTTKLTAAGLGVPGYAGIFGRQVKIYLGGASVAATDTDKMLRVQSVTINGDLSREELKELGNSRIINKRLNTPLRLTCSVDVAESDLEHYAKLIGSQDGVWTAFSGIKYNDSVGGVLMNTSQIGASAKLIVNIYKERTDNPTTIMKTIVMSGLYMTSKSRDASATARGSVSLGFQGSYLTVTATGVNPLT
jgi:hypothetical protein